MRIDRLTLQNFRCFENETWEFAPGFNVLIGDNGTGKTAVLDALAVSVKDFLEGTQSSPYVETMITREDIRLIPSGTEELPTLDEVGPVKVNSEGTFGDEQLRWEELRFLQDGISFSEGEYRPKNIAGNLVEKLTSSIDVEFPVIAYYPAGRLCADNLARDNEDQAQISERRFSRFDGYKSCLKAQANERTVRRWLHRLELAALQRKTINHTLEAVKRAVIECLEQWDDFYFDVLLGDLVVKNDRGDIMLSRLLSHGQRNVLSMIADLAYRCAVLNPHLRDRAAQETVGVVLIDELDLHLHPKWQRRIIDDLRRTFPKVQFFVATHSPIILQNLSPETDKVIDFSGEEWLLTESSTPNDILKRMGVEIPQQDWDWLQMFHAAQEYYRVLEEAKAAGMEDPRLPTLRARLDELMIPFEKNPAFAAFLEVKRVVAGIDASANGTGKTK